MRIGNVPFSMSLFTLLSGGIKKSFSNFYLSRNISTMNLKEVVQKIETFAPLSLAESWDNVGLLIEPSEPLNVKKILLTNDLTEKVMLEALNKKVQMIISYHPPIFQPLKRITQNSWKERIVARCLENKIALYSPHTAWDSCKGGVNDWLIESLPILKSSCVPITPSITSNSVGAGRISKMDGSLSLNQAIESIKKYTNLSHVHLAVNVTGNLGSSNIKSVAVCAGSGSSVLKDVEADLYVSGEMSHHEVLNITHSSHGSHVILLNHSNSERGFLNKFKNMLPGILESQEVEVFVSELDEDPLKTY